MFGVIILIFVKLYDLVIYLVYRWHMSIYTNSSKITLVPCKITYPRQSKTRKYLGLLSSKQPFGVFTSFSQLLLNVTLSRLNSRGGCLLHCRGKFSSLENIKSLLKAYLLRVVACFFLVSEPCAQQDLRYCALCTS